MGKVFKIKTFKEEKKNEREKSENITGRAPSALVDDPSTVWVTLRVQTFIPPGSTGDPHSGDPASPK